MKPATLRASIPIALGHPRLVLLAGAMATGLALTLSPANTCSAQVILINEPVVWREGKALTVAPGQSLRVAGAASHPDGVSKVLVNGREAVVKADSDFPDLFRFETQIVADTAREVTIDVILKSGKEWSRSYRVDPSAPAAAGQAANVGFVPLSTPESPRDQPSRPNAWEGFRMRSVGYGLAAAGGLVMAAYQKKDRCVPTGNGTECVWHTRAAYRGAGLAVAGAAVAALAIDAMVTSSKARQDAARPSDSDQGRLDLAVLQVSEPAFGRRLDLVAVRFRRASSPALPAVRPVPIAPGSR
jgi:hypothetical protein